MAGLSTSPNELKKASPLQEQMNDMDRRLMNLGDTVVNLRNRLAPVCIIRDVVPTGGGAQPLAPLSLIANGIRQFNDRIDQLTIGINEIINDLEI